MFTESPLNVRHHTKCYEGNSEQHGHCILLNVMTEPSKRSAPWEVAAASNLESVVSISSLLRPLGGPLCTPASPHPPGVILQAHRPESPKVLGHSQQQSQDAPTQPSDGPIASQGGEIPYIW